MSFIRCYVIECVGLQSSYAHGKPTKVMELYYSSKGIEFKTTACLDIFSIYLHYFLKSSLHAVHTERHTTTLIKKSTGYAVVVCNLAYYIYCLVVLLDNKSLNFKK